MRVTRACADAVNASTRVVTRAETAAGRRAAGFIVMSSQGVRRCYANRGCGASRETTCYEGTNKSDGCSPSRQVGMTVILTVEDESLISTYLGDVLEEAGY